MMQSLQGAVRKWPRPWVCLALVLIAADAPALERPADPTTGGQGGRLIRVTTLAKEGPGSLRHALQQKGRRIIVFEVGGAIDLQRSQLKISEPYVTVAGQTAPSPGISLLRGGIEVATHDVVLSHLTVLAGADGQPSRSGWEPDAFSTVAAHAVVVENCTFLWGVDENMSASGPRFDGATLAQWRAHTSHDIVFRLNLAAEGLSNASHSKGEHSKGSLVHDNATGIVFDRNVWAYNMQRSPLVKGGARVLLVNNLIYSPGKRAVHYNLLANEWQAQEPVPGQLTAIGNVLRAGKDTDPALAFLMIGGIGELDYYGRDNRAFDAGGGELPMFGAYGDSQARINVSASPLVSIDGYELLASQDVEIALLPQAGARPWDRDDATRRVLGNVAARRGRIIDDETQVGGYPVITPTRAPFRKSRWNLATLQPKDGVYPGQTVGGVAIPR
jgi:hypothetical protein